MRFGVPRGLFAAGVVSAMLASGSALAQNQDGNSQGGNQNQGGNSGGTTRSVPEFDPAAIGAIAALVAGGAVLLARRRKGS